MGAPLPFLDVFSAVRAGDIARCDWADEADVRRDFAERDVVLGVEDDWLAIASPSRWHGGFYLMENNCWRWDTVQRCLIRHK